MLIRHILALSQEVHQVLLSFPDKVFAGLIYFLHEPYF